MLLINESRESIIEALSQESLRRVSIRLNDTYKYLIIGDDEVPMLNKDQVLELIEELTELHTHMEEVDHG